MLDNLVERRHNKDESLVDKSNLIKGDTRSTLKQGFDPKITQENFSQLGLNFFLYQIIKQRGLFIGLQKP